MRQTSLDAWEALRPHLSQKRWDALYRVRLTPGATAGELERIYSERHINKRLSELERMGLVKADGARNGCLCWWPTTPESYVPPTRAKSWKTRALEAEAKVLELLSTRFVS